MPLITIDHPKMGRQNTRLSSESAAAATTSYVDDNTGFASNTIALFGNIGQERSRAITITGISGSNSITHAALTFSYPARTPIQVVIFNQIQIYSAETETGEYTLLTTVNIAFDEEKTVYDDLVGDADTWYKIKYKNSVTTATSDFSDAIQGVGYGDDSLRALVNNVLEEFGDPYSEEVTRKQVASLVNSAVRVITTRLIKAIPDYRKTTTTQALVAATTEYSYPTRFLKFDSIYIGASLPEAHEARIKAGKTFDPTETYSELEPIVTMRGSVWEVNPGITGNAYIYYWDYPAKMDTDTDTHGLPYGAEDCIVIWCLYRLWSSRDGEKSDRYRYMFKDVFSEYVEYVASSRAPHEDNHVEIVFGDDIYEI